MRQFFCLLLLLLLPLPAYAASPVKARPLSGIGVLVIRGNADLPLYREPGIGRLALLPPARLPLLSSSPPGGTGIFHAVVLARRPEWLRIIFDEAENSGWLERRTAWDFYQWEEFLPGRQFTILAGLRQDYYQLRILPAQDADVVASPGSGELFRIGTVSNDWVQVQSGGGKGGWLRWRDDNSRLLINLIAAE